MTEQEFKSQIKDMTHEQKIRWGEIHSRLIGEINERDYKTKSGYRSAISKVYSKTISEYLKSETKHYEHRNI